jgi:hypothetical protein
MIATGGPNWTGIASRAASSGVITGWANVEYWNSDAGQIAGTASHAAAFGSRRQRMKSAIAVWTSRIG